MDHLWWYTARSGGYVAWALLAGSVIWGLMLSGKVRPGGVRPNWMLDLHRFLGGLATIFTGVHVASIMADSYTSFGVADVLMPFVSDWNPVAVAWGIAAMYLLAAVEVTSLARKHLSKRAWRMVHALSLPLYVVATVHLFTAGTDASNIVSNVVVWSTSAVIVGLAVLRWTQHRGARGASPEPVRDRSTRPVVRQGSRPGSF